ncbi:MAG TPA: hypothetical protein DDY53_00240 [Clostridiales bacterium]|mgnify:FL=1|jgi:hypothetical protein|nr:hypothetical protein [Clostridiales bacterium]
MYITETTDNVRKLMEEIEHQEDISKLKFLIYIFGLLNNNQINDKNEANPDLMEDNNVKIFNLESIGLPFNACTVLLQYFVMLYNGITNTKDIYEDTGNIIGVAYSSEEKTLLAKFEKLGFNEKLDIFSEIIIRCDNETYFKSNIVIPMFDSTSNGYAIAKRIKSLKND